MMVLAAIQASKNTGWQRKGVQMFREMARIRQQLQDDECIEILIRQLRGVLSVLGDDDYPYGMPMNHYYCPDDGKIYFHGGFKGHKIDAIKRHGKASYCVLGEGFRREGEWSLNFKSVIAFGRIEIVDDHDWAMEVSRRLSRKFIDDERAIEDEVQRAGRYTLVFALVPEHITGKIVNES